MDIQELKQKALASGAWEQNDYRAAWLFPDGSVLSKTYHDEAQHHGYLVKGAGLLDYIPDLCEDHGREYWRAVNSICKNFLAARACGRYEFQVWDRRGFKSIVKYLEGQKLTDSSFTVDIVSEGICVRVDSLESVNYEIGRAIRNSTAQLQYSCYNVGLHEAIESKFAEV